MKIKKILLPVDLSKITPFTTCRAVFLSKVFNSKVILYHVIETSGDETLPGEVSNMLKVYVEDLIKGRISDLKAIESDFKSENIPYKVIAEQGKAYEEIIKVQEKMSPDIVMIGNSRKIKKILLGSNADRIIRYSTKPVWVCKNKTCSKIKEILIPIDFSEFSETAMEWGISLAKTFDAKLTLVHVVKPYITNSNYLQLIREKKISLREYSHLEMDKFLFKYDVSGLKYTVKILMGEPSKKIKQMALKIKPQLIIMGTHGRAGISHFFLGSVTEKVLEEICCDVLVVRPKTNKTEGTDEN